MIAHLGDMFVSDYVVPFILMAMLLLVALAGAIVLARDQEVGGAHVPGRSVRVMSDRL